MKYASVFITLLLIFFSARCMAAAKDPCMDCHGVPGLDVGGEQLWIYPDAFAMSKHQKLSCSDCHKGEPNFPHAGGFETRCDLLCHAPGVSHEALAAEEKQGVHANIAVPSCIGCHTNGESPTATAEVEALCTTCHADLEPVRYAYPDSAGAFGYWAHKDTSSVARTPSCVDCHGFHAVKSAVEARKSCSTSGCHANAGETFGELFNHVGWGERKVSKGFRLAAMGLTAIVGVILFLHTVRRPY